MSKQFVWLVSQNQIHKMIRQSSDRLTGVRAGASPQQNTLEETKPENCNYFKKRFACVRCWLIWPQEMPSLIKYLQKIFIPWILHNLTWCWEEGITCYILQSLCGITQSPNTKPQANATERNPRCCREIEPNSLPLHQSGWMTALDLMKSQISPALIGTRWKL